MLMSIVQLVARPSTSPLTPITFQLSLSSTASLSFADVLASSYLSYEIESTPTQGVDRETSHHSAAIKVALGNLTEMGDAGNLEWVGEILPEKRERTIIASWIKVQVSRLTPPYRAALMMLGSTSSHARSILRSSKLRYSSISRSSFRPKRREERGPLTKQRKVR